MNDSEKIKLKSGESYKVELPGRGGLGLELYAEVDNSSLVDVKRLETQVDVEKEKNNIGGPIPVVFSITALRSGSCTVTFLERKSWDKEFTPIVRKKLQIEITD
jgi:predicted secreted protein